MVLAIAVVAGAMLAGAWGLNRYLDATRDARMAKAGSRDAAPAANRATVAAPLNPGPVAVPAHPGTAATKADADGAAREEALRRANRSFREMANESPEYRAMSAECQSYMDVLQAFADGTTGETRLEDLRKRVVEAERNYDRKCVDHEARARKEAARQAEVDAEMKPWICKDLRERVDHFRSRRAPADDPDWARKAAARGDEAPGPQPVFTDPDRRALADAEAQIAARGC